MSTPWSVPKLWPGATVAILASGASMSQEVADSVRRLPRIVVNDTYRLALDADMLVAHDIAWWQRNPQVWQGFPGLKVSGQAGPEPVFTLRDTGEEGFDDRPDCVRGATNGNSGHMAVHVAAHTGASRILLCGFDMTPGHWHPMSMPTDPAHYPIWAGRLERLAELLWATKGVRVACCTPSALRLPWHDMEAA